MRRWRITHFQDPLGAKLADGHYSRRTVGAKQFMPPGERYALVTLDDRAVFGWWRPDPPSGLKSLNGLDGWTCSIFRNTGFSLSSELVLEAEMFLYAYAEARWGRTQYAPCGPSGLLTYVWDSKVESANPGYCFKLAGWRKPPAALAKPRSADGKKSLLWKPYALAGVQACGIDHDAEEARHAA